MEIKQAVEYAIENYSNAIEYKGDLLDYLRESHLHQGVCSFLSGVVSHELKVKVRDLGFKVLESSPEIREQYASMNPDSVIWWFLIEPYECETEEDMRICLEARKTVLEEILKTL